MCHIIVSDDIFSQVSQLMFNFKVKTDWSHSEFQKQRVIAQNVTKSFTNRAEVSLSPRKAAQIITWLVFVRKTCVKFQIDVEVSG